MPEKSRYEDIIALPRHVSPTRTPMSRLNRAAQFAPFAALSGYDDAIAEAARLTEDRIDLSPEEKALIDRRLNRLSQALPRRCVITVTYFLPDRAKAGGQYLSATGAVKKLRPFEGELVLEGGATIAFEDIIQIDGELFED